MKDKIINILISGLGGQGVLLGGEIVAETFVKAGYDVKVTSAHGMAQRGGSIASHIRIGKKIYSPLISEKEADILIGMELLEINRWLKYLKKDGLIILLDRKILFGMKASKVNRHIDNLKDKIRNRCKRVLEISYDETAKDLKNIMTANMLIVGALSNYFSVKKVYWLKVIREKVPFKMRRANLFAFELGREKFGNAKNMLYL